jgi:hypothetical protein
MPVLSLPFDIHGRPIVELYVSISSVERQERLEEGNPIPPAISVFAMVDTGAGRSHIDLQALGRLEIDPVSEGKVYSASGDGPRDRDIYVVDLAFAGDQPGPLSTDIQVFGTPLEADLRVGMLLGRDILQHCFLTHDGIGRRFTLGYNPPPIP